jgi:hypothetical protein
MCNALRVVRDAVLQVFSRRAELLVKERITLRARENAVGGWVEERPLLPSNGAVFCGRESADRIVRISQRDKVRFKPVPVPSASG